MTSANSSWVDKIKANKKIMSNKSLWSYILVAPVMFVTIAVYMIFMFIRSNNYGIMNGQDAAQMLYEKQFVVMESIGLGSEFYIMFGVLGIIYAFTKFSYLFSMSKLDFYFSLPTTSARRVQSAYMVAITNFVGIFLSVDFVAILIAAVFKTLNAGLMVAILIQSVRVIVLFFTCFTMTTLAILLCGTRLIALILTFVLFFSPLLIGEEFYYLNGIFYKTRSYLSEPLIFFSPYNDARSLADNIIHTFRFYDISKSFDLSNVMNSYLGSVRYDIDMLVTGVIATILVVFVYKYRRAEHVGKTIVFRPVRWVIKVLVCITVSLGGMVFIYYVFDVTWNKNMYIVLFVSMLAICAFTGSLIEICLDSDIKSFSKGKRQTFMAMAILLLIFFIYRGDLLGYDSYVPSASSVESAAFVKDDFGNLYDPQFGYSYGDYSWSAYSKEMQIKDVDSFLQIAQRGMECAKACDGDYWNFGWENIVAYNLKNGKTVYRYVIIPYDIDTELMDKITSSEEFIKGHIPCFSDTFFESDKLSKGGATFTSTFPGGEETTTDVSLMVDLINAYRQDVLEHYKFSYIRDNSAIGNISINYSDFLNSRSCWLPVYENFNRTIYLLKENGLFDGVDIPVDKIDHIEVSNYFKGYNFSEMSEEEALDIYNKWYHRGKDYPFDYRTYTDKDKIKEIMENATYNEFYDWGDYYKNTDYQFTIDVDDRFMDVFTSNFVFKKGSVPKFIYEDFNK